MNNIFKSGLSRLIQLLTALETTWQQETKSTEKPFDDLAPLDNLNVNSYSEALTWAIANPNIKNIALTGSYGSGKSSVLRSFERANKQYDYLNISLATFDATETNIEQLIEHSILQQIFYSTHQKNIPESRFRRVYAVNKKRLLWFTIGFISWLLLSISLFRPEILKNITIWHELLQNNGWITKYMLPITFLVGFYFVIRAFFKLLRGLSFSKLNLTKIDIELAKKDDASILNRYLDEIIYFFEVSKANVVIVEDIDRFKDPLAIELFSKLREINDLLNKSEQIKHKEVVFIYALKDDLFSDTNRTKFFDFIVPIIPVINQTNSAAKLLEKAATDPENYKLTEEFITDISIYIKEMRMLKNIFNEFLIYYEMLDKVELNADKLFAMVVYKNLHPDDFSKLQFNKGLIAEAFAKRHEAIRSMTPKINEEITQLKAELAEAQRIHPDNIVDLRNLYLSELLKSISQHGARSIYVNGQNLTFDQVLEDEHFSIFQKETNIYYANRSAKQPSNLSFSQLQNSVNVDQTYQEREADLTTKMKILGQNHQERLTELHEKKAKLEAMKLHELMAETENRELFSDELKGGLLTFLLINGHIDEMYSSYISFFYEGALLKEEMEFLHNLKERGGFVFADGPYVNCKEMLKKIRPVEFSLYESLNTHLITYMLENPADYTEHIEQHFKLIARVDDAVIIEFIEKMILHTILSPGIYVDDLIEAASDFWTLLSQIDNGVYQESFAKLLFEHLSVKQIVALNKGSNHQLAQYISNQVDFMRIFSLKGDIKNDNHHFIQAKAILPALDIKFKKLIDFNIKNKFCRFVYKQNLYRINLEMIYVLMQNQPLKNHVKDQPITGLSYAQIKANEQLFELHKYLDDNINTYVANVLLDERVELNENELSIVELLNSEDVLYDNQLALIEKSNVVIPEISNITKTLWSDLIALNKVAATWNNVKTYFNEIGEIDDLLIGFLDNTKNAEELSKNRIGSLKDELVKKLNGMIYLDVRLSTQSFKSLIKSSSFKYKGIDFSQLETEKVEIMIDANFLVVNENNYNSLRANFSPLHIRLAERDVTTFMRLIQSFPLDADDLLGVIRSKKFTARNKEEISDTVDLSSIKLSGMLANELVDLYIGRKNFRTIDQITLVLTHATNTNKRVKLLLSQMPQFSNDQIRTLLNLLPHPYAKIAKHGTRPRIPNSQQNHLLAQALKQKGFISTYETLKQDIKINTKRG